MKCTSCNKKVGDKDKKAYIFLKKRKLYFCWDCNLAGKVEDYIDNRTDIDYNDNEVKFPAERDEISNYS